MTCLRYRPPPFDGRGDRYGRLQTLAFPLPTPHNQGLGSYLPVWYAVLSNRRVSLFSLSLYIAFGFITQISLLIVQLAPLF